jgi:hypothetical protein
MYSVRWMGCNQGTDPLNALRPQAIVTWWVPLQPTYRAEVDVAHSADFQLLFDLLQSASKLSFSTL